MAWAAFQNKREDWMEMHQNRWSLGRRLSLAGAALGVIAVVLVLTVAPVRAWAESLLGIFRVERFTVLEIDPSALKGNALQNNQLLNQTISRVLSDEVTVTQKPQKPQPVADRGHCIESRRLSGAAAARRNAVQHAGGEWRRHADEAQSRPYPVDP